MSQYTNIVDQYIQKHGGQFEAIFDHAIDEKRTYETLELAIEALKERFTNETVMFVKLIQWSHGFRSAKVCCHAQFFDTKRTALFTRTINLVNVRWQDILPR